MKLKNLISVGPWKCPTCGFVTSHGFWFRFHLQHDDKHKMSAYRASRFMARMCETMPVYKAVSLVPVFVSKSALVQVDLFDSRIALVK